MGPGQANVSVDKPGTLVDHGPEFRNRVHAVAPEQIDVALVKMPLHAFGVFGVVLLAIGLAIEAYLTIGWFGGSWIGDRPAFMLGILFLIVGAQFIFFGLLAEMIAYASKREEDYSITEVMEGEGCGSEVPIAETAGLDA